MRNITRVGVDLAKMVIQVHAVDVAGKVVINRCIKRASFLAWCSGLPAGCAKCRSRTALKMQKGPKALLQFQTLLKA